MGTVSIVVRPLQVVGTIVLARLLDPNDFGTVAFAMVLLGTAYMFVGLGMDSALIHTQHDRAKVAFQTFVVTAITGIVAYVFLFINTNFFLSLLGDLDPEVFRRLLPLVLISTLTLIPEAMLSKELLFGRVSSALIASELAYMGVAIVLAWQGWGLWSLVYGKLASALLKAILIWVFNPSWDWLIPKPWDGTIMRSLFHYGLQTTAGGVVSYFHTHWDDWFVGRNFGTQALGYYSKAYDLSNNMLTGFSRSIINGVFFPSYAKIKDDQARLTQVYLKSLYVVLLIMVPIAFGVLFTAPQLVPVLLGDKWIPMIIVLQIFAFMVLIRPLSENTVPLFLAVGRPRYMLWAGLALSIVMVPLIFGLQDFGIEGVAVAVVISHLVGAGFNAVLVERILPGTARLTGIAFAKFIGIGLLMLLVLYLVNPYILELFGGPESLSALICVILLGIVVYGLLAWFTQRPLLLELLQLFDTALSIKKRLGKPQKEL